MRCRINSRTAQNLRIYLFIYYCRCEVRLSLRVTAAASGPFVQPPHNSWLNLEQQLNDSKRGNPGDSKKDLSHCNLVQNKPQRTGSESKAGYLLSVFCTDCGLRIMIWQHNWNFVCCKEAYQKSATEAINKRVKISYFRLLTEARENNSFTVFTLF
jgi:hypothetical protein